MQNMKAINTVLYLFRNIIWSRFCCVTLYRCT
jgi:hypothetical protein